VNAKRYLVFKDVNYPLSEASRTTLGFQGGPMSAQEAAAAEADPQWETVLRMRRYDELAKEEGLQAPSLRDDVLPVVEALVRAHQLTLTQPWQPAQYLLSREQLRYYAENGTRSSLIRHLPTPLAHTTAHSPPHRCPHRHHYHHYH
jgi:hypothetical protein